LRSVVLLEYALRGDDERGDRSISPRKDYDRRGNSPIRRSDQIDKLSIGAQHGLKTLRVWPGSSNAIHRRLPICIIADQTTQGHDSLEWMDSLRYPFMVIKARMKGIGSCTSGGQSHGPIPDVGNNALDSMKIGKGNESVNKQHEFPADLASNHPLVAHTDVSKPENKCNQTNAVVILYSLSHIIDRLACEMSFKCLTGGDGHTTALAQFHTMSNFHWDAKLVLTLAAFPLNYEEFWFQAQIYSSNQLARSMAILRQVPMIMEHSAPLKPRFDVLNKLIKSVLELTQCIIHFKELPSMYVTHEVPAMARTLNTIPTAVYWNVRGIIACATQITSLTSIGHEYGLASTEMQSWELSTLFIIIRFFLFRQKDDMKLPPGSSFLSSHLILLTNSLMELEPILKNLKFCWIM
ncbi:sieve element occlusion B-like protein, partial [Tanacetum coccineum]